MANCYDGRYPKSCLRLFGMTIENQSAHSIDCSRNCPRLYWNEDLWRAVGGGAAVALSLRPDGSVCGIPASNRTLAISNVWSYGQGGRPENNQKMKALVLKAVSTIDIPRLRGHTAATLTGWTAHVFQPLIQRCNCTYQLCLHGK
jgi:hypothetical protein